MSRQFCWLLSLLVALATPARGGDLTGSRPNIVLVMTDDQGYGDLACHGNPLIKTPHLDRLHAESLRFTDFQVSPTCAPTRASLMTGRHEFKCGVTHTILERERLSPRPRRSPRCSNRPATPPASSASGTWATKRTISPSVAGSTRCIIHGAGGIGQTYPGSCGDAPRQQVLRPGDSAQRHV